MDGDIHNAERCIGEELIGASGGYQEVVSLLLWKRCHGLQMAAVC